MNDPNEWKTDFKHIQLKGEIEYIEANDGEIIIVTDEGVKVINECDL